MSQAPEPVDLVAEVRGLLRGVHTRLGLPTTREQSVIELVHTLVPEIELMVRTASTTPTSGSAGAIADVAVPELARVVDALRQFSGEPAMQLFLTTGGPASRGPDGKMPEGGNLELLSTLIAQVRSIDACLSRLGGALPDYFVASATSALHDLGTRLGVPLEPTLDIAETLRVLTPRADAIVRTAGEYEESVGLPEPAPAALRMAREAMLSLTQFVRELGEFGALHSEGGSLGAQQHSPALLAGAVCELARDLRGALVELAAATPELEPRRGSAEISNQNARLLERITDGDADSTDAPGVRKSPLPDRGPMEGGSQRRKQVAIAATADGAWRGELAGGAIDDVRPILFREGTYIVMNGAGVLAPPSDVIPGFLEKASPEVCFVPSFAQNAARHDTQRDDVWLILSIAREPDGTAVLAIPAGYSIVCADMLVADTSLASDRERRISRSWNRVTRIDIPPEAADATEVAVQLRREPGEAARLLHQDLCSKLREFSPAIDAPFPQAVERAIRECAKTSDVRSKIELVTQAFALSELLYSLDGRFGDLLAGLGENKLAFLNGLRAGTCETLSFQVCAALQAVGVPAVIVEGLHTSRGTRELRDPGHAQVLCFTPEPVILDPTRWTIGQTLAWERLDGPRLERLAATVRAATPAEAKLMGEELRAELLDSTGRSTSRFPHELAESLDVRSLKRRPELLGAISREELRALADLPDSVEKISQLVAFSTRLKSSGAAGLRKPASSPEAIDDPSSLRAIALSMAVESFRRTPPAAGRDHAQAVQDLVSACFDSTLGTPPLQPGEWRTTCAALLEGIADLPPEHRDLKAFALRKSESFLNQIAREHLTASPEELASIAAVLDVTTRLAHGSRYIPPRIAPEYTPIYSRSLPELAAVGRALDEVTHPGLAALRDRAQESLVETLRSFPLSPLDWMLCMDDGPTLLVATLAGDSKSRFVARFTDALFGEVREADGRLTAEFKADIVDRAMEVLRSPQDGGFAMMSNLLERMGAFVSGDAFGRGKVESLDLSPHRAEITAAAAHGIRMAHASMPHQVNWNLPGTGDPVSDLRHELGMLPHTHAAIQKLAAAGGIDLAELAAQWPPVSSKEAAVQLLYMLYDMTSGNLVDSGSKRTIAAWPEWTTDFTQIIAALDLSDDECARLVGAKLPLREILANWRLCEAAGIAPELSPIGEKLREIARTDPELVVQVFGAVATQINSYGPDKNIASTLLTRWLAESKTYAPLWSAFSAAIARTYVADADDPGRGAPFAGATKPRRDNEERVAAWAHYEEKVKPMLTRLDSVRAASGTDVGTLGLAADLETSSDPASRELPELGQDALVRRIPVAGMYLAAESLMCGYFSYNEPVFRGRLRAFISDRPDGPLARGYEQASVESRTIRRALQTLMDVERAAPEVRAERWNDIVGTRSAQQLRQEASSMLVPVGSRRTPGFNENLRGLTEYQPGQPLDTRMIDRRRSDVTSGKILLREYAALSVRQTRREIVSIDVEALQEDGDKIARYLLGRMLDEEAKRHAPGGAAPLSVVFCLGNESIGGISWEELRSGFAQPSKPPTLKLAFLEDQTAIADKECSSRPLPSPPGTDLRTLTDTDHGSHELLNQIQVDQSPTTTGSPPAAPPTRRPLEDTCMFLEKLRDAASRFIGEEPELQGSKIAMDIASLRQIGRDVSITAVVSKKNRGLTMAAAHRTVPNLTMLDLDH